MDYDSNFLCYCIRYGLLVGVLVFCASSSELRLVSLLLVLYGVNVLQRWLENSAACSSLLLAHMLSAFLIAGISFIGFFIFLDTFHIE